MRGNRTDLFIFILRPDTSENSCVSSVKAAVVGRVNGDLWDLSRPLVEDCELQLLGFDSLEGRQVQAFECFRVCLRALTSQNLSKTGPSNISP